MASLVIAEHDNVSLKDATHKTVTAAAQISSPVHILVAGENCAAVADAAAKIAGVEKVLLADAPAYARQLAELPNVDPGDDAFEYKMTVLKELVAHHVEEEEDEMFPMAEKKLGDSRSSELAQQMAGPKAA